MKVSSLFWGKKLPRKIVFGVGFYTIGYTFYDQFNATVMHNMIREPVNMDKYGKGSYAVVTGACSTTG